MYQLVIKDAQGKVLQSREKIRSFRIVAQEMHRVGATWPLSVWRRYTTTGSYVYDGDRTRAR